MMKLNAMVLDGKIDFDWVFFEKSLAERFGVNAVTFRGDGRRRTPDDGASANDICRMIRGDAGGFEAICGKVQRIMSRAAQIRKRGVAEECLAGMYKIVVPVLVAETVDGFVSVCGRPFFSHNRVFTASVARLIGEEEETLRRLMAELVPIDARTIKAVKLFIAGYTR